VGVPVGERQPTAPVAERAAQYLGLAVATVDGPALDIDDGDLDVHAPVARFEVREVAVAARLVGHRERFVLDGDGGGLPQIEFGVALPLADAGVPRGDRITRTETEVGPRGVGNASGPVCEFALEDDLVFALVPNGALPDGEHARGHGDVRVLRVDLADVDGGGLAASAATVAVAVLAPEAALGFLHRHAVRHELLQIRPDLLFVYAEVGGELLGMVVE
jgi:hypothetical protein